VPNPVSGTKLHLAVQLESDADSLELKLYTKSMMLIMHSTVYRPFTTGWNKADYDLPAGISSGLYYVVLTGHLNTGETGNGKTIGKMYYLR